MSQILEILHEIGFAVTFIPQWLDAREPYLTGLGQRGVEVLDLMSNVSGYIRDEARNYDFALTAYPGVASVFLPLLRRHAPSLPVFYDTIDLHHVRERRRYELEREAGAARAARRYLEVEVANVRRSTATITVTDEEAKAVLAAVPSARVHVLPNIHDAVECPPGFTERKGLLFTGNFFHKPNPDAVRYFAAEIFPIIRSRLPGIVFYAVGNGSDTVLRDLPNSEDFRIVGWIPDLQPYLSQCRVFVAPLRYGAGMKGKIGQSMAHGLPVVTTTIGAEGMGLVPEVHCLQAENPEEFAAAVVRLYTDQGLWESIAQRGLQLTKNQYSRESATRRIKTMLREHGCLS